MDSNAPPPETITLHPIVRLNSGGSWQTALAHARPHSLTLWITRGQGQVMINGRRLGFSAQTLIHIPAGHLFSLDISRQCFGHVIKSNNVNKNVFDNEAVALRVVDLKVQNQLAALLDAMQHEQTTADTLSTSALLNYYDLIKIAIKRQIAQGAPSPKRSAGERLSHDFCSRIANDLNLTHTMATHAEALKVTPTHLTRVCKTQTGRTAAHLLTEMYLHRAQLALTSQNLSVCDISKQLNFGSAAYFTRFVRQHTGQSPTQIRQSSRKNMSLCDV